MQLVPRDSYQKVAFLILLVFLVGCCINPPYTDYLWLQHAPTLVAMGLLVFIANRYVISPFSFTLIVLFLVMHMLGARYLYSNVPYDDWFETIMGFNLSEIFGFERNHYDRLTHLCYGLLLVIPIQEFERRYFHLSLGLSAILAIEFIIATSALYEIVEWLVAITLSPEWAGHFLGHQGDMFDAQKDMALATLGASISIGLFYLWQKRSDCKNETNE